FGQHGHAGGSSGGSVGGCSRRESGWTFFANAQRRFVSLARGTALFARDRRIGVRRARPAGALVRIECAPDFTRESFSSTGSATAKPDEAHSRYVRRRSDRAALRAWLHHRLGFLRPPRDRTTFRRPRLGRAYVAGRACIDD